MFVYVYVCLEKIERVAQGWKRNRINA